MSSADVIVPDLATPEEEAEYISKRVLEGVEKGVKLSKDCSEYLESAKQKIITLTEKESEDNG